MFAMPSKAQIILKQLQTTDFKLYLILFLFKNIILLSSIMESHDASVVYVSTSTLLYLEKLSIHKTKNTRGNNDNFYFSPRLFLKLYNPKVIKIDSNHITVLFQKDVNFLLYSLLKKIETALYTNLCKDESISFTKKYNILYETDTGFSLKLYLPKNHNTYCVKRYEKYNGSIEETKFKFPNLNSTLDTSDIEIKNIWLKNKVIGFNLELKTITYNLDSIFD